MNGLPSMLAKYEINSNPIVIVILSSPISTSSKIEQNIANINNVHKEKFLSKILTIKKAIKLKKNRQKIQIKIYSYIFLIKEIIYFILVKNHGIQCIVFLNLI